MRVWKALFWLLLFLFVTDLLKFPFRENIGLEHIVHMFTSCVALVPIYGYAYQKEMGNKEIAIGIFAISAINMGFTFRYGVGILLSDFDFTQVLITIVAIVMGLIYLFPQFMYAFKCNHLWERHA